MEAALKLINLIKLLEANVIGVFSEALSAEVEAIFADQTMLVSAGSAVKNGNSESTNHSLW